MKINNKLISYSNYSTTEQVVGTWLGKPLYRIVVNTTTPSQVDNWKTLYSGNVKAIIRYGGYASISSATDMAVPYNATYDNFWFSTNSGNIRMATDSSSYINKNIVMWFEYTKTTD